ncbi:hypothetical protein KW787_02405 [Candidatus Pacearchaeota archaeon]|nr:hypothetical protein [Candidatus Pacearchaeota archaeon]
MHKKYIKKNGKVFGPYLYENKRLNGKVVTSYVGKPHNKTYLSYILILLVLGTLLVLTPYIRSTGLAVFSLRSSINEPLAGSFEFSLKQGELLPSDAKIIAISGSNSKEILLSEIIDSPTRQGDFYIKGSNVSGSGEGYGIPGEKESFPELNFSLLVHNFDNGADIIVPGSVSKDKPFVYNLNENETASIAESSVNYNGISIDASSISLITDNSIATVSTSYSLKESGFGSEFSGDSEFPIAINLSKLGIVAESSPLIVKIAYNDEIIFYEERNLSESSDTIENNQTFYNSTEIVDNQTIVNESDTHDPIVLNQPVRWTKKIPKSSGKESVDLPLNAVNITIKKNGKLEKNFDKKIIASSDSDTEIEYYTEAPRSTEENSKRGKKVTVLGPDDIHYTNVKAFTNISEDFHLTKTSGVKIYWVENSQYLSPDNIKDQDGDGVYDYIEWTVPHLSTQTFEIILVTQAEHLDAGKVFVSDIYNQVHALDGIWSESIPDTHYVRITFERSLTKDNDISIYPRVISGTPKIEVYEKDKGILITEFTNIQENQYNKVLLSGLQGSQDTFDLRVVGGSVEFDHIIDPSTGFLVPNAASNPATNGTLTAQTFTLSASSTSSNNAITQLNISDNNCSLFVGTATLDAFVIVNFTIPSYATLTKALITTESNVTASTDEKNLAIWNFSSLAWFSANTSIGANNTENVTTFNVTAAMALNFIANGTMRVILRENGTASSNLCVDFMSVNVTYEQFPVVNLQVPTNGTTTGSATMSFNGTFTDDTGLSNATLYIWNSTSLVNTTLRNVSSTGNSSNVTFVFPRDGVYFWNYQVADTQNNYAFNSTNFTITYDGTPPSVTIILPLNQTYTSLPILFNVSLNENGTCNLTLNNGVTNYTMTANSSNRGFNATNGSIADGGYTVKYYCIDLYNNLNATASQGFSIDTIPPVMNVTLPLNTTYTVTQTALNYTISGAANCWYSTNNGVTNTSVTCGANVTGLSSAEGSNNWTVYANDSFNNANKSTVTFFVDTIIPLVQYGTLTDADGINVTRRWILVNVTASDTNLVNISIRIFNSTGLVNITTTSSSPNLINVSVSADGNYTFNATATDVLGNRNTTATRTITIDTVPPIVTINLPSTNSSTSSVSFNITLNEAGDTAQYSLNSGVTNVTMTKNGNTDFNATNASIADGNYIVKFYVNDTLGNFNRSTSRTFTIDTIKPSLNFSSPTQNSGVYLSRNFIEINATANDTNFANTTIRLYNSTQALNQSNLSTSSAFYINYSQLTDGLYFYNATAFDTLNNRNETVTRNITLDTILPVPLFGTLTEANASLLTRNNIVINITASDTNFANITIRLFNSTQAINQTNVSSSSSFLVNYTGLSNGVYFFNATAVDLANNQNTTITRTVTIDTVSPIVNITVPANITYTTSSFVFNVSLNENGTVLFSLNGGVTNYSMTTPDNRNFNYTNSSIRDGTYTFNAYTNDTAGNRNDTASVVFTIDTTPPVVNITYPLNTTYSVTQTALNYTVSGANTCWYTLNSGTTNTTVTCGNNVTGLSSSEGSNVWTVYANDSAGNRNSSRVTFFTDTLTPTVQFVSPTDSNASFVSRRWILINATAADTNLVNISIRLFNSTGLANITTTATSPNFVNVSVGADGVYTFNATATDTLGTKNTTLTQTITVDTVLPLISIGVGTDNDGINVSRSNIYVNVSVTELNEANITFSLFNTTGIANSTTFSTAVRSMNWTSLPDGNYTYNVTLTDQANNRNTTITRRITLDTTIPLISYGTGTANNNTLANRNWIYVNVSVTEINEANITFNLYNSTSLVNTTLSSTQQRAINWTSLNDGVYNYNVTLVDRSGNVNSTQTRVITLDTLVPAVTINFPQNTTYFSLPLNFNVSLNENGSSVSYTLNNGVTNITMTTNDNRTYNASNSSISDGSYTFKVYSNDSAGNRNDTSSIVFTIDRTPPSISYTSPTEANGSIINRNNIIVNVTSADASLANITINLYNVSLSSIRSNLSTSSPFFINYSGLSDGTYYFNATATDSLNNQNSTITRTVLIDTGNPSINYSSPTQNSGLYLNRNFIEVNVTSNDTNLQSISIFLYNSTQGRIRSNTSSISSFYINYSSLNDGLYFYNSTANDTAGNSIDLGTRNITLDRTYPQINITYPQNISYTTTITTLNYTVSDTNIQACWYTLNLGLANTSVICGNNITGLSSSEGSNTWIVYANDSAGNTNGTSLTFFTDAVIPLIQYGSVTDSNGSIVARRWVYVNVTASDTSLINISIRLFNSTGLYNLTTTLTSPNTVNISVSADGIYTFNATATDSIGNRNTTATQTITIDTIPPVMNLTYPLNTTYATIQTILNYTISGANNCWYSLNLGVTNTTITCGTNVTGLSSSQGSNTWIIYSNDTAGNRNISSVVFFVDSISPLVQFVSPTRASGSIVSRNSTIINVTSSDTNLANITIRFYNSSSLISQNTSSTSPFAINYSGLADGIYFFNASALDILNNINFTETRNITINTTADLTSPQVTINVPVSGSNYTSLDLPLNLNVTLDENGTVLYTLDSGLTNTTMSSIDSMNYNASISSLSDGSYIFTIYANDTSGNRNDTTSTSFRFSTPASASVSSGGGSSKSSEFSLDKDVLNVKIKQGETKRESIKVTNTGGESQHFTVNSQLLDKFVILSDESFSLAPGESKTIYADFFASDHENGDIHAGRIVVQGKEAKSVNVILEVQEKIALFDIKSDLAHSTLSHSIFSNQKLNANIKMTNIGDADKRVDVVLEYFIKDFSGNEINLEEETLGVYGNLEITRSFSIPSNLKEGDYLFSVRLTYSGSTATSANRFSIVQGNSLLSFARLYWFLPLLLVLVVILTVRLGNVNILKPYWDEIYVGYLHEKYKLSLIKARYNKGDYDEEITTIKHFPRNLLGALVGYLDNIYVRLLRVKYRLNLIRVSYKLGVYDEEIFTLEHMPRNILGIALSYINNIYTQYLRLKYKLILIKLKYRLGVYDSEIITLKHIPQNFLGTILTCYDIIYVRYLRLKYAILMRLYPPQERKQKKKRRR